MNRQQLFAAFFFAVFLFLLYQFYRIFSVFLVPLAWAALLALTFYPLHLRLTRLLRGRIGLASFLFTTVVILVVMVPTVLLSLLLANESVTLYQRSSEIVASGQAQQWLEHLKASTPLRGWRLLAPILAAWKINIGDVAVKAANALSAFLVSQATDIAKNVVSFVLNFFLTTFALFFFFRDGARIVASIRDALPMERAHKDLLLERLYDTVSAVVQGTLATAAAQGVLAGLGLWALSIPFAAFLGCVTGLCSLLPMGTPLVWVPLAVYLAVAGSPWRALLLALWGTLVATSVDNVIRPLIIGGRTEIPTLLLFFGLLGGLQAYGFLGLFLAPAIIAVLVAFVHIYRGQYVTTG
jgi:predicted PurR-regulated permease PerM